MEDKNMTARDAISLTRGADGQAVATEIEGGLHLLDVLPRLLDSPGHELRVSGTDENQGGVIDETSLLEALSHQIAPRYDCCVIEMECAAADYSASHIARAVEDSDVHIVDLLTNPGESGHLRVTLRVRCEDPEATVHSLERYGYEVTATYGGSGTAASAAFERLLAVQTLINI